MFQFRNMPGSLVVLGITAIPVSEPPFKSALQTSVFPIHGITSYHAQEDPAATISSKLPCRGHILRQKAHPSMLAPTNAYGADVSTFTARSDWLQSQCASFAPCKIIELASDCVVTELPRRSVHNVPLASNVLQERWRCR